MYIGENVSINLVHRNADLCHLWMFSYITIQLMKRGFSYYQIMPEEKRSDVNCWSRLLENSTGITKGFCNRLRDNKIWCTLGFCSTKIFIFNIEFFYCTGDWRAPSTNIPYISSPCCQYRKFVVLNILFRSENIYFIICFKATHLKWNIDQTKC